MQARRARVLDEILSMEAYCFKCRSKHALLNPQPIFLSNGAPATQGTCSNCGNPKVIKMGRTPAHEGLNPPVVERKATTRRPAAIQKSSREAPETDGRPLVIVESPTKARTIGRFLGSNYRVAASIGHIRDLPKNRLGVDVAHDFAPTYVIPVDKRKTVQELKQLARRASEVWLATDPDREGEAISWHLQHVLKPEVGDRPFYRAEFHEITRDAIAHAFSHPRQIDERAVNAQQARRILDRLVGYELSPLLRNKLSQRGLSAGRVQSVALRLVVEREREIQAFVPKEYWTIEAELAPQLHNGESGLRTFIARLFKIDGQEPDLRSQADAQRVVDALGQAAWSVVKVESKERNRRPAAPFTTSTLQQEANRKLGFNARRTMAVAQQLYEGVDVGEGSVGLITYMRTDSVNVAASAQQEAREFIQQQFGDAYLPPQPPRYTTRAKNAQEAHEAIRPTSVYRTPESVKKYLERDQFRLYELIWKRFIASQMANAILDVTTVDIAAITDQVAPIPLGQTPFNGYWFRATGSVVKFPGFLKVYVESLDEGDARTDEDDERQLPKLAAGDPLDLRRLIPEQHFTQPPPRYTEASLVKALEEYGIGRPSTYATILSTIQTRNYVRREGKQLVPTELGFITNDLLVQHFPEYIDVNFTARVEEELDEIETGARAWQPVLHAFYGPFHRAVERAAQVIEKQERKIELTGELCPQCGAPLAYKQGRYGKFIGCTNFPTCRFVSPIPLPGVKCPKCGGNLVERRSRSKSRRVFYGCANYPNCDFVTWNKPLPILPPDGCEGLVVEVGKGKAKCLGSDVVFDIPEDLSQG